MTRRSILGSLIACLAAPFAWVRPKPVRYSRQVPTNRGWWHERLDELCDEAERTGRRFAIVDDMGFHMFDAGDGCWHSVPDGRRTLSFQLAPFDKMELKAAVKEEIASDRSIKARAKCQAIGGISTCRLCQSYQKNPPNGELP